MIKNSSGMLYTGKKETGPFLAYSLDVKSAPLTFTTGNFLHEMLYSYLYTKYGGTEQEIEQIITESGIITSDDDISITNFNYGHDALFGSALTFIWILQDYIVYRIWLVEGGSPSDIESNITGFGQGSIAYTSAGTDEIGYELPGNASLFDGSATDEYCFLEEVDAHYISNLAKFVSKYIDPIIADQNYSSTCSNNTSSFKQALIDDNVDYQNITTHYTGNVSWYSEVSFTEGTFVIDYDDTIMGTGSNSSTNTSGWVGYLELRNLNEVNVGERLFNIHNHAYQNDEFLHIKVYIDQRVNFPLSVVPITIVSDNTTMQYGTSTPDFTTTQSGTVLTGDSISSRGVCSETSVGSHPIKVIYQVTYQQPQNCVYDVTCIPGTLTIEPDPTPSNPSTPEPDPTPSSS